jgi:hypothetical protein
MMQNWSRVVGPLIAWNWAIYRLHAPLLTSDDPVVIIGGPSADRRIKPDRRPPHPIPPTNPASSPRSATNSAPKAACYQTEIAELRADNKGSNKPSPQPTANFTASEGPAPQTPPDVGDTVTDNTAAVDITKLTCLPNDHAAQSSKSAY